VFTLEIYSDDSYGLGNGDEPTKLAADVIPGDLPNGFATPAHHQPTVRIFV
jgi:hypothetical protein